MQADYSFKAKVGNVDDVEIQYTKDANNNVIVTGIYSDGKCMNDDVSLLVFMDVRAKARAHAIKS